MDETDQLGICSFLLRSVSGTNFIRECAKLILSGKPAVVCQEYDSDFRLRVKHQLTGHSKCTPAFPELPFATFPCHVPDQAVLDTLATAENRRMGLLDHGIALVKLPADVSHHIPGT